MSKLLVFGRSGQVAQELARLLPDAVFWGRDQAELAQPQEWIGALQALDCSGIINAAAYTAVDRAESEADLAMSVNATAPRLMAETAARLGVPFIHISTDYVFDGAGNKPWTESCPTGPLGVYGQSKLAGEQGIAQSGAQAAVLRTSWVFSAHGNNFVKTILRLGAERPELRVVSDQIGGPTPAAAIARACVDMMQAMQADKQLGGVYHFAGAPDVSWADFARTIMAKADLACEITNITTADYPTAAPRPANSRMECTKIRSDFGIERPDWQASLKEILAEWKK